MTTDENKVAYLIDADGLYLFEYSVPTESTDCDWLVFSEPPKTVEGYAAVYNKAKQKWSLIEDYRGVLLYNTETKTKFYKEGVGGLKSNECVYSAEMSL